MEQTNNDTHVLRLLSNQMADAVERVSAALVLVNGRQRQPASGVVYASDLVLTADHVLEREEDLTIQTHDGNTLPVQFVGRDPSTDLAVLRATNLNIAAAATATDAARVGQLVLAVGRNASEGPMASAGIVSAVGGPLRTGRGATLERYIRTDATPYPGFSGGPLIDTQGAVLGITTTGLVNGIALAVPSSIAWNIADTLAQQGYIKRGYLGISSQLVRLPHAQRSGRTQEHGLLIVKVDEDSPAQKGGVMLGDIVVGLDGKAINDTEDLQVVLARNSVGKTIPLEVIRGNTLQTLQITVGQRK
ncbi:MAG TPA: trypsin-like peptidase domain-containing protein [Ktedonobacteraceae bacterium]|nr:trypsin-like peptidase domain-containing protein [Ktedonobacteraceae bacterium]